MFKIHIPMSNIVQFRPVSSVNTQEIVRLSVSWSRTGKSCLTLVKPMSLFVALLWCLIEIEKLQQRSFTYI